MSTPETTGAEPGQDLSRSSVKVTRNAKGDPQWEIKVYVGDDPVDVQIARETALATHRALESALLGGGA